MLGTNPVQVSEMLLFEIQTVPGKGRGLVARTDIAKDTRILQENPLFTSLNLSTINLMESTIATKLKSLSKDQHRQFFSLHNNFSRKYPFSGVMKTNALPCGPDSIIGGIYPTICLINHSCLPNAHNNWNSDTEWETIHAIRHINVGDEITISYDRGGPSEARRPFLKDAFGFDCSCSICSLPSPELERSDARRLKIQHLDDAIGDGNRVMNRPDECLADCRSLLQTLEEEHHGGAGVLVARLYYDAFQISITHGDQARASVFAQEGYKARVICEGEDSPETQKMKTLMQNPAGHRNFGASTRWKTAKGLVPKGLDAGGFEAWLWRRGR